MVLCLIHPGERPIVFPQDERPGLAADSFLIHDDPADLWPGRDGVHYIQQSGLDDRAQSARAHLAPERLIGRGRQRPFGKGEFDPVQL